MSSKKLTGIQKASHYFNAVAPLIILVFKPTFANILDVVLIISLLAISISSAYSLNANPRKNIHFTYMLSFFLLAVCIILAIYFSGITNQSIEYAGLTSVIFLIIPVFAMISTYLAIQLSKK